MTLAIQPTTLASTAFSTFMASSDRDHQNPGPSASREVIAHKP